MTATIRGKKEWHFNGFVTFTQSDGSKWAISLTGLMSKFRDEMGDDAMGEYGPGHSDFIAWSNTLHWREVMHIATMYQEPTCDGPDYNYGWQHADDKDIDYQFNVTSVLIKQATEAAIARRFPADNPQWVRDNGRWVWPVPYYSQAEALLAIANEHPSIDCLVEQRKGPEYFIITYGHRI